ncbi:MAG: hypothetical protein CMH25_03210 [Micavibrio sp.]|nr:hypothetical protein [Micavibrio sp.]|tara:strand:- start:625087 stop:627213 length:2127 start_codon:yes stop_codon:yes gene_type:complete
MSEVEEKEINEAPISEEEKAGVPEQSSDKADEPEQGNPALIRFKDEIEIYPEKRLPDFDRGDVKAYEGKGLGDTDLLVMVCDKSIVPRRELLASYDNLDSPHLVKLVAHGKVYWPSEKREVYIFAHQNKFGQRLLPAGSPETMYLKPSFVSQKLVPSLINVIEALDTSKIVHGNISLSTLFTEQDVSDVLETGSFLITPCLATPAFYAQDPAYLTIEKCFCSPLGEGEGTQADDLYAMGVTIACALRKDNPLKGKSRKEVARYKMEYGSYHSIVGEGRLSGPLLELVRGLLMDDPAQRWTLEDVQTWRDGQRVNIKHSQYKRHKAKRPMEFAGEKYLRPELLISAMSDDVSESVRVLENEQLGQWVDRALADKTIKVRVEKAEEALAGAGYGEAAHVRVGFILAALSETMPLHFKSLKLMPQAIGTLMAHQAAKSQPLDAYEELVKGLLPKFWMEHSSLPEADSTAIVQKLRSAQAALKQKGIGYGAERAIYTLCYDAPCLSPAFEKYYITHPEDYLLALDDLCLKNKAPSKVIDRHVAAFLSVRDRQTVDNYMIDLNSNDPQKHGLAILRVLTTLQRRTNVGALEGVTAWFVDNVAQTLTEVYASRERRSEIEEKLEKAKHKGAMEDIAKLLDSPYDLEKDVKGFKSAHHDYLRTEAEIKILENIFKKKIPTGMGRGREVAAMVSSIIGAGIIMITIVSRFAGISIF